MDSRTTKFESLLEAVPDALVGMDQSGAIRFVNHRTEALFGYDRDDLVGQHIATLVPENLWRTFLLHRWGYFADPRSRSMGLDLELRAQGRDGKEFPVNVSVSPIDNGDVLLEVTAVSDATKLKQAFADAQRMTAIVEHSDDAIIGETLGGTITSWNGAAERMYGYAEEEIIGRTADILAPPDRVGEIAAMLANVKQGRSVDHHETTRVRKDGTPVTVSISVSPIFDEEGVVMGASTIARDVSEQRKGYEAARAMIESSQDSLVTLSPEGIITDANATTVKATGVPRERLIGTAFTGYFTDPEKAREIYQRVFTDGSAVDYPLTIRHLNGMLTDVLYNASVHRGTGDDVIAVFAAARDVTKLKQAFETTRAMIESSLDSLVSISPGGRITDVNEATVEVTGVPRDTLIGTAFSDYFTDPQEANEIYQRVFDEGAARDYPLTIRHQTNGRLTEVLYNASVYHDAAGNVLGVFAAARDVTMQKQIQREMAEQQARSLDRLADLESFQRLTVGRELQMIELKKRIAYLEKFAPDEPGRSDQER